MALGFIVLNMKNTKPKTDSSLHFVVAMCDTGIKAPYIVSSILYRRIVDTFKIAAVDETTFKKTPVKDTLYYFWVTASAKDSIGAPPGSVLSGWVLMPKERVLIDGGLIDKIVDKYKKKL